MVMVTIKQTFLGIPTLSKQQNVYILDVNDVQLYIHDYTKLPFSSSRSVVSVLLIIEYSLGCLAATMTDIPLLIGYSGFSVLKTSFNHNCHQSCDGDNFCHDIPFSWRPQMLMLQIRVKSLYKLRHVTDNSLCQLDDINYQQIVNRILCQRQASVDNSQQTMSPETTRES